MSRDDRGRGRARRRLGRLPALGGLAAVAATVASCAGPGVSAPPVPPAAASVPLASATAASGGWASVAMGHLGDPSNTYWELFHLTGTTAHWTLATPPGVASNGGLVMAPGPGASLAAGFEPTDLLRFSPLARSSDGGSSWTAGAVPGALVSAPDALAAAGAGTVALLRAGGGTVVVNGGDLDTWTPSATLAGAGPAGCGPTRATAVAALTDGSPAVGLTCDRGSRVAILLDRGGRWRSVGPVVPAAPGRGTEVLRLIGTDGGAAALVRAWVSGRPALYAAWSTDGLATWSVSPVLVTGTSAPVATGTTPAGGFVVTAVGPAGRRTAAVIQPGASPWQSLPAPPTGTAAVAALPGGGFDALAVDGSNLDVSVLGSGGWTLQAQVKVPIQYGSSS